MKSSILLFSVLLALCGIVLVAAMLDEVPSQRGLTHPDYETMALGGDPAARHGQVLWLGWAYGALTILFFIGLIDFSLFRKGRPGTPGARRTIWLLGLGFEGVFLALVLSYRAFMADPLGDFVLGFPPPSAWMMYGIWGFPLLFIALYILRFEQWVISPADEEEFARLVARGRIGDGGRS